MKLRQDSGQAQASAWYSGSPYLPDTGASTQYGGINPTLLLDTLLMRTLATIIASTFFIVAALWGLFLLGLRLLSYTAHGPHSENFIPVFISAVMVSHYAGGYIYAKLSKGMAVVGLLVAYLCIFICQGLFGQTKGIPFEWTITLIIIGVPSIMVGVAASSRIKP